MEKEIKVYRIQSTLKYITPKIWREFEVLSNVDFYDLHMILQGVMGWYNCHLHEFKIGDKRLAQMDEFCNPDLVEDETSFVLSDLLKEKIKFTYVYDFGDDWNHILSVKKVYPLDPQKKYPICIGGLRACPPEDCGGIIGYDDYFEIIKKPKSANNKEILDWFGNWDPEEFDLDEANKKIHMKFANK